MNIITPGCRVTYSRAGQRMSGVVLSIDGDTAIIRPTANPEVRHNVSARFECVQIENIEG